MLDRGCDRAAVACAAARAGIGRRAGQVRHRRIRELDPSGYKTAAEFFEQRLKVDKRTAQRNLRVARYATPADELLYGPSNLDAALGYLEAKYGKLDGTLPVAFARLKIAVVDGKDRKLVPFAQLSAPAIAAATRALLAKKSPAPKNPTRAALETVLAKHPALARVVVHERDGLATFANVPVASLALFGGAVAKAKLPAVKTPKKKGA